MRNELKLEHRGHEIMFREGPEHWECETFSLTDTSLAALKRKVDKADAEMRRVKGVPCVRAEYAMYGLRSERRRGKIVLLDGESAWVVWPDAKGGTFDRKREKIELKHLCHDTPEITRKLDEVQALLETADRARATANKARDELPRLTVEMVQSLNADLADAEAAE